MAKARAARPPPAEQRGLPEPTPISMQDGGGRESSGAGGRLLKLAVFGLVAGLGLYYGSGWVRKTSGEVDAMLTPMDTRTFEKQVDAHIRDRVGGAEETATAFVTGHADLKWALGEPLQAQVGSSNVSAGSDQGSGSMKLIVRGSSDSTTVRVSLVKSPGGWQVTDARYQDKAGNEQELSL